MNQKIVIIDYGLGNLHSVYKKIRNIGYLAKVTNDWKEVQNADKIILPGVGHFGKAMDNLRALGLMEVLNEQVLIKQKNIIGICLGMQLLANESEEGNRKGLGWIDAHVQRFRINDTLKYKIPLIGWNQIEVSKSSRLMKEIDSLSEFYFVHSFHFVCNNKEDILNYSDYEYRFVSAVEKNNIFGVQYHPEKSHDIGEKLLSNFIHL
jgi:imidazole glycerol-phosphate synthase subunit HisH